MEDYRDVDENYTASLEKIILDAGLTLPSIYGNLSKHDLNEHKRRVEKIRYGKSFTKVSK